MTPLYRITHLENLAGLLARGQVANLMQPAAFQPLIQTRREWYF